MTQQNRCTNARISRFDWGDGRRVARGGGGGGGGGCPQKKWQERGRERKKEKKGCVYACEAAAFQPFPK